jgi:hypothetical protein
MGLVAAALAVLTVAFFCLSCIEALLPLLRRWRRQPESTATGGDGEEAVVTSKIQENEGKEEDVVKDDNVKSAALSSRSVTLTSNPSVGDDYNNTQSNDDDDDLPSVSDPRQWQQLNKCFCDVLLRRRQQQLIRVVPAARGLVKDQLKSAVALLQLGAGGCYHEKLP